MLIHDVNLRITVHRIQIEMSWGDFQSNVGSLTLFIIPLEPLSSFHRPYHALITGWQELMKIFPVTDIPCRQRMSPNHQGSHCYCTIHEDLELFQKLKKLKIKNGIIFDVS